jgi:hypothetical protein
MRRPTEVNQVAFETLDETRMLLAYINQDVCKDWPEHYKAQAYSGEGFYLVKCFLTQTDIKEALAKLGLKGKILAYESIGQDN